MQLQSAGYKLLVAFPCCSQIQFHVQCGAHDAYRVRLLIAFMGQSSPSPITMTPIGTGEEAKINLNNTALPLP